jgi:hypothetical protein
MVLRISYYSALLIAVNKIGAAEIILYSSIFLLADWTKPYHMPVHKTSCCAISFPEPAILRKEREALG